MNRTILPLSGLDLRAGRISNRIARVLRGLLRKRDERELSMKDTDQNATGAAAVAQSRSDADDVAAGAPAEEGGEG